MRCNDFTSRRCRSCAWLELPYQEQLRRKEAELQSRLSAPASVWCPSVGSADQGFRNKSKMVVSGTATKPVLGIVNDRGESIDLCRCPLYPSALTVQLEILRDWLGEVGIEPYRVAERDGELKFVLLSRGSDDQYMLRLVLRSEAALPRIRALLPKLQSRAPGLVSISANIQPVPMAIIEGPLEISLSGEPWLRHRLNGLNLYQRPKGFFQTNTDVAQQLYATARDWLADIDIRLFWDLFCGSGGFGLHCLTAERQMIGIEIEAEAVACARRSATEMGFADRVSFMALDLTQTQEALQGDRPDAVIVNPPRRGLGAHLCAALETVAPDYMLYSSCNAASLGRDLDALPSYRIERLQLFDMFAHTAHFEVLVLLRRCSA